MAQSLPYAPQEGETFEDYAQRLHEMVQLGETPSRYDIQARAAANVVAGAMDVLEYQPVYDGSVREEAIDAGFDKLVKSLRDFDTARLENKPTPPLSNELRRGANAVWSGIKVSLELPADASADQVFNHKTVQEFPSLRDFLELAADFRARVAGSKSATNNRGQREGQSQGR